MFVQHENKVLWEKSIAKDCNNLQSNTIDCIGWEDVGCVEILAGVYAELVIIGP